MLFEVRHAHLSILFVVTKTEQTSFAQSAVMLRRPKSSLVPIAASKKCDKQPQREVNVSASRLVIQHAHSGNNVCNRQTEAQGQRRPSTHAALIPDPV
jgi:hypothetical protein